MTDALTDAVRRLKGLREDVERLKAARNESGEVRLFFTASELAVSSDQFDIRGTAVQIVDGGVGLDSSQIRGPSISETDVGVGTDTVEISAQNLEQATYNSSGYNTGGYNG